MTKEQLTQLLANGKLSSLVSSLENISPQLDHDLQKEVLLQIGRYRTYNRQMRSGLLTREEQTIELAKINTALLEIIHEIPEINNHVKSPKRNLLFFSSVLLFLSIITISYFILTDSKQQDSELNETINQKKQSQEVKSIPYVEKEEKNKTARQNKKSSEKKSPQTELKDVERKVETFTKSEVDEPPTLSEEIKKDTKTTQKIKPEKQTNSNASPTGNVIFNNPKINTVINQPSAPVTINNDFTEKKDTTNEK